jgi:hypothetical protein
MASEVLHAALATSNLSGAAEDAERRMPRGGDHTRGCLTYTTLRHTPRGIHKKPHQAGPVGPGAPDYGVGQSEGLEFSWEAPALRPYFPEEVRLL